MCTPKQGATDTYTIKINQQIRPWFGSSDRLTLKHEFMWICSVSPQSSLDPTATANGSFQVVIKIHQNHVDLGIVWKTLVITVTTEYLVYQCSSMFSNLSCGNATGKPRVPNMDNPHESLVDQQASCRGFNSNLLSWLSCIWCSLRKKYTPVLEITNMQQDHLNVPINLCQIGFKKLLSQS